MIKLMNHSQNVYLQIEMIESHVLKIIMSCYKIIFADYVLNLMYLKHYNVYNNVQQKR